MSQESLVLAAKDSRGVITLTLNRPQAFNALSEAMLEALQTALDSVAADDSARAVVIAAAGKAFCAGHDLREMRAAPSLGYYERLFAQCTRMMMTSQQLPVPVIARVGRRHRGRLPVGGDVRSGGGRKPCAICCQRRQPGALLQHAERGAESQPVAQVGFRDAGHG